MLMRMLISIWLVPPALNILMIAGGYLISRWYFRIGAFISFCGLLSLWLLATPYFSNLLHKSIEQHAPLALQNRQPGNVKAIVVLGASHFDLAPEYGVSTPTPDALVRLHYAANLHNKTGLPIMLTGGPMNQRQENHSEVLSESLKSQFGINAKWLERKSSTTWQNAIFSAEILHPLGIKDVLLVTHSYHMQRAVNLFEMAGFNVTAAPTHFSTHFDIRDWRYLMPDTSALKVSSSVFHEYLGLAWYHFKLPVGDQNEANIRLYAQ